MGTKHRDTSLGTCLPGQIVMLVAVLLIVVSSVGNLFGEEQAFDGRRIVAGLGDAYSGRGKIRTNYINLTGFRETTPSLGIPFEVVNDSTVYLYIVADSLISDDSTATYRVFVKDSNGQTYRFTAGHASVDTLLEGTVTSRNVSGMLRSLLYLKAEAVATYAESELLKPTIIKHLQSITEIEFRQSKAAADGKW